MCGECKGESFWCDSCETDIELAVKNCWAGAYVQCLNCDTGRICKSCTGSEIIYCRWCVLEEKVLDLQIEALEKRNTELREQLCTHLELFKSLLLRK
jgi:hypothetical protein